MQEPNSLQGKTTKGLFWSFGDLMAVQGIQFFVQIFLARLLVPEDFGLIALILVFIAISNNIIDSGFTQALIREKDVNQEEYSTVFYFNIVVSIMMFTLLFFLAEPISSFFKESQLLWILRILSFSLIINSFGIIQRVILTKNVDFKKQTKINITAGTLAGGTSIIFAMLGFGVWSIVINTLLMQFIQTLLLWFFNKWVPSCKFNIIALKRYFVFGSKLVLSGLIDTIYNNLYFVIIGRFFSTSTLGYYTNAVKFRDVAAQSLTTSIQRVTYPILSSIKEDELRLKKGFQKVIKTSSFIIFPCMIGLASVARPLITLIFGDKWLPSVTYFQLLCFAGMLYPLHALNLNILQVKGRSDLFLRLEIIKKSVLTILIIFSISFDWGIKGLIIVAVFNSYISLFINIYYCAKEISYSMKEQLKDILPIFSISIVMGGIVYSVGIVLHLGNVVNIICQVIVGLVIYYLINFLAKVSELQVIVDLVRPLIIRSKQKIFLKNN